MRISEPPQIYADAQRTQRNRWRSYNIEDEPAVTPDLPMVFLAIIASVTDHDNDDKL